MPLSREFIDTVYEALSREVQPKNNRTDKNLREILEKALTAAQQNMPPQADSAADLIQLLLAEQFNERAVLSLMNTLELDTGLMRSVIVIDLQYHENKFFNINLNLGYQSSTERLKEDIMHKVKTSPYLTSQDLCAAYDRHTIVIIKSFIATSDIPRTYSALDKICTSLMNSLLQYNSFTFKMSYGNLVQSPVLLRQSFIEAREMIELGKQSNNEAHLYILNNMLFDNVCRYLHPQVINKLIKPLIEKLIKKDGSLHVELIECAECFTDSCMNFSIAAQTGKTHRNTIKSRLEKLHELTGLDLINNFTDAFIAKMLAVYIRHAPFPSQADRRQKPDRGGAL